MALTWLVATALFGFLEAATVSLVSIWFMGGTLAAFIAALLGGTIPLQISLFFAVSILLLAALRPLVRSKFSPRLVRTNADSNIGREAVVTEAIDNLNAAGQVKVGAMYWTARSESGDPIARDTVVVIRRIEGVKVIVAPVSVPADAVTP